MTQAKQEGSTVRELMDEVARLKAERDAEAHSFKNLHRLLCDRFDYTHDETDWKRDQVSLIEWIASRIATLTARNERLMEALRAVITQPNNVIVRHAAKAFLSDYDKENA